MMPERPTTTVMLLFCQMQSTTSSTANSKTLRHNTRSIAVQILRPLRLVARLRKPLLLSNTSSR